MSTRRGTHVMTTNLRDRLVLRHYLVAAGLLAASAALSACQPASSARQAAAEPEREPGWTWSDERVMETVNAVRAGRDLQPAQWPDGARVAVLLSFDVDNETVTGLRYGDATVGSLSEGQYGARRALPRSSISSTERACRPRSSYRR